MSTTKATKTTAASSRLDRGVVPSPKAAASWEPRNLLRKLEKLRTTTTASVTCPASRHVLLMGRALPTKRGYPMLLEEPGHCARSLLATVLNLWQSRQRESDLRAALAELVALKDMKDAVEGGTTSWGTQSAETERMACDYAKRKPKAWEAARKVLARHNGPVKGARDET